MYQIEWIQYFFNVLFMTFTLCWTCVCKLWLYNDGARWGRSRKYGNYMWQAKQVDMSWTATRSNFKSHTKNMFVIIKDPKRRWPWYDVVEFNQDPAFILQRTYYFFSHWFWCGHYKFRAKPPAQRERERKRESDSVACKAETCCSCPLSHTTLISNCQPRTLHENKATTNTKKKKNRISRNCIMKCLSIRIFNEIRTSEHTALTILFFFFGKGRERERKKNPSGNSTDWYLYVT